MSTSAFYLGFRVQGSHLNLWASWRRGFSLLGHSYVAATCDVDEVKEVN